MNNNNQESYPKSSVTEDIKTIFLELYQYRELLYQITLRDIKIRYKQAIMGFGWAIFMPILIVLSGLIIRSIMAYLRGSDIVLAEMTGIVIKSIPWAFFVGSIGFANASLISNTNLVTKIYFPREILPLSAVFAQGFDSSIGTIAVILVLPFLGVKAALTLLWVLPLLILLFLFTSAVALFLSCANLFFRDVKYITQVILTFGIFFTPVFYEPSMLGPLGAKLIMLNPLSPLLEGLRLAVIDSHNLLTPVILSGEAGAQILAWSPWYLLYAFFWSVFGFFLSSLFFHRLEFIFAEYA